MAKKNFIAAKRNKKENKITFFELMGRFNQTRFMCQERLKWIKNRIEVTTGDLESKKNGVVTNQRVNTIESLEKEFHSNKVMMKGQWYRSLWN